MNARNTTAYSVGAALAVLAGAHAFGQDSKKETKPDPAAVAMLQEAHDKRETFPAGFSGLTAGITVSDSAGDVKGTLNYSSSGEVKLKLSGATSDQEKWANDQLGSAFGHRRADDFAHGDGSNPLTFDPDDHSPLGRQIALNDKGNSHYRVKDGHITQVNRSMGPTMKFSITVQADRNLPGGKYLPSTFTVTYFDASGAIKRVDIFTDRFQKVGEAWVPSSRRVVTAENGGFTARAFALDNISLLPASTTAAK